MCKQKREPLQEAWESGKESDEEGGDELQEAQNSVTTSEKAGNWSKQNNLWQTLLQVSLLSYTVDTVSFVPANTWLQGRLYVQALNVGINHACQVLWLQ